MQKFVQNLCKKVVQKSCAKICAKIVCMMTVHFLAGKENAAKNNDKGLRNAPARTCWIPNAGGYLSESTGSVRETIKS